MYFEKNLRYLIRLYVRIWVNVMPFSYIAIVGLEGCGKSSIMSVIIEYLNNQGEDVIPVREPGGTPIAEMIRDAVKCDVGEPVSPESETLGFYMSRLQLLNNRVIPALNDGKIVVSDRCYRCSDAYQGAGGSVPEELIATLKKYCLPVKPDLVFFLDVDPVVGLERARGRGELDRIEKNNIDFFNKARENYHEQIQKEGGFVVDANQNFESLKEQVLAILQSITKGAV